VSSPNASLAALRALVLRLRFPGANALSSLPSLSPRSRFSYTDERDEENEQNRQQNGGDDNGEGDTHFGPPSSL
jgi:hypothetical protein